jgi:hypothetical protein
MIDPERELPLTLTAGQVNVVFGALGEAPYRIAAPVIETLRRQVLAIDPTAFERPPAPAGLNGATHPPPAERVASEV